MSGIINVLSIAFQQLYSICSNHRLLYRLLTMDLWLLVHSTYCDFRGHYKVKQKNVPIGVHKIKLLKFSKNR